MSAVVHALLRLDIQPEQPPQRSAMDGLSAPQRVWTSLAYTVDDLCYRLSPGGELRGIAMWTVRMVTICMVPLAGLWLILGSIQAMLTSFSGVLTLLGVAALLIVVAILGNTFRR
ncbi:MAG TPA: hypothetical protein DCS97_04050 [Planctomycetes bacterium]|nr:hypothetical protein [Planctomycetota bacterium]